MSAKTVKQPWGALYRRLVEVLGPPKKWEGHCSEVAKAVVDFLPAGEASMVRGLWVGPVAEGTMFSGRPVSGHSWVKISDGRVVDPTRWVFEGQAPYVYVGPQDEHYDENGSSLREALMGPAPAWDAEEKQLKFNGSTGAWSWIEKRFKLDCVVDDAYAPGQITRSQACYLANLSPRHFWEHAAEIYAWLNRMKLYTHIPIDHQRLVERELPAHR